MAGRSPEREAEVIYTLPAGLTKEELTGMIVLALHDQIEEAVRAAINRAKGRVD